MQQTRAGNLSAQPLWLLRAAFKRVLAETQRKRNERIEAIAVLVQLRFAEVVRNDVSLFIAA